VQIIGKMKFSLAQNYEAARDRGRQISLDIGTASFPQPASDQLGQFLVFLSLHL
jgi:hypothetical protein